MDGYHRLSQLMGSTPAVAIFRRYGTLNIQNVLYMPAEINELEKELQDIAMEDRFSGHPEKERFSREWWRLVRAQGEDSLQWKKWLELRAKLDEYNSALIKAKEVFNMPVPIERDTKFLRTWLSRPQNGDNFLRGMEASVWSQQNTGDLVAVSGRPGERDVVANWMAMTFLTVFHRSVGRWIFPEYQKDEETGFTEYNDAKIMACLTTVVTLLSSMFPVTSTIALYLVKGMPLRLGMIALFVILFSFILAIFTSARRVEIFAATAAYVPHGTLLLSSSPIAVIGLSLRSPKICLSPTVP